MLTADFVSDLLALFYPVQKVHFFFSSLLCLNLKHLT